MKRLVIAEKPSVGMSIASVLGVRERKDAEGPAFFCWIPKLFGKRVISTIHGTCEIMLVTRKNPDFMRVCAA